MEEMHKDSRELGEGDSDSSLPSPLKEQYLSSDMEASGEESDPRPPPGKTAVWIVKRQGHKVRISVFCCGEMKFVLDEFKSGDSESGETSQRTKELEF